ncbi:MAG: hypothetical protein KBA31_02315 [Alphaproteobacteria bacterium]|nr:hypothetical protein [Alphaproteobacteria bacterium]
MSPDHSYDSPFATLPVANDDFAAADLRLATADDLRRLFGELRGHHVADLLAGRPTVREIEAAASWLSHRTKPQGIAAVLAYVLNGFAWRAS